MDKFNFKNKNICRICSKPGEELNCIFASGSQNILYKVSLCSSIKVQENDGLPSSICNKCVIQLNSAYCFRILSERSDEQFRKLLKNSKICIKTSESSQDNVLYYNSFLDADLRADTTYDVALTTNISNLQSIKDFSSVKYNNEKIINVDEKSSTPYACTLCSKIFTCTSKLQRHVRSHSGERPFLCQKCPKSFANSFNLKVHFKTHRKPSIYSCTMCDKDFSRENSLSNHMRTHKEKPPPKLHQCDVCGTIFKKGSYLVQHLRTHTGERPYQCSVCKLSFAQQSILNHHIRTHTKERPYKCSICPSTFTAACSLAVHIKVVKT